MAGRFLRHARAKSDWGNPPARSAEVQSAAADPEPTRRAPGPKDTRHWCKGKPGRAHKPVITIAQSTFTLLRRECAWGSRWVDDEVKWRCLHSEVCSACGKILREPWQLAVAECPGYPSSPRQRAAAETEARESAERADAWRARSRPVITGPQGYRRKRQEA